MSERIVITGIGVVSPLGHDRESFWSACLAGRSGARLIDSPWVTETDLSTKFACPVTGFDQNRFFAGVGHHLTPHIRMEVAYLNQVLNGRSGSDNTMRNSGFTALAFTW